MDLLNILNSNFLIKNLNNIKCFVKCDLDYKYLSKLQFQVIIKDGNDNIYPMDSKKYFEITVFGFKIQNKKPNATQLKKHLETLFLMIDSIYICSSCDSYFFDDSFKDVIPYKCSSCIIKNLYFKRPQIKDKTIDCSLCYNSYYKWDLTKDNSACCGKGKDPKELNYMCNACYDKIERKIDEDDDLNSQIYINCPWCRSIVSYLDY